MEKEKLLVAFSGGRTSAYMSWWLKENMSHLYDFHFVYANTGLEHEKTLEFVDKCDKHFNLNLTWVEAIISTVSGVGTEFKIVDFNSATRDNSLFYDMCSTYGLPNQKYMHCTRELKNIPMKKWADKNIGKKHRIALGIRYDEFRRVKNRQDAIYPLATITKITKEEVLEWWSKMPFDLEIEEHYGNCVGCYKKSDKKLKMIADENPEYFEPFEELERKFSLVKTKKELGERKIYRHHRTAREVKKNLIFPKITFLKNNPQSWKYRFNVFDKIDIQFFSKDGSDECAEECGSMISEYESEPIIKESQGLLDFI